MFDENLTSAGARNRITRLEEVQRRYNLAFTHLPTPPLSVHDIAVLRGVWVPDHGGLPADNPKNVLLECCRNDMATAIDDWEWEKSVSEQFPDIVSPRKRPDTLMYNDLEGRIRTWTMLECLKVIKIFEDFRKIECNVIQVTSEMIHTILEGARAKVI